MEYIRCNNCWWYGKEEDLELLDEGYNKKTKEHHYYKGCPKCKTDTYLTDITEKEIRPCQNKLV